MIDNTKQEISKEAESWLLENIKTINYDQNISKMFCPASNHIVVEKVPIKQLGNLYIPDSADTVLFNAVVVAKSHHMSLDIPLGALIYFNDQARVIPMNYLGKESNKYYLMNAFMVLGFYLKDYKNY